MEDQRVRAMARPDNSASKATRPPAMQSSRPSKAQANATPPTPGVAGETAAPPAPVSRKHPPTSQDGRLAAKVRKKTPGPSRSNKMQAPPSRPTGGPGRRWRAGGRTAGVFRRHREGRPQPSINRNDDSTGMQKPGAAPPFATADIARRQRRRTRQLNPRKETEREIEELR